MSRTENCYAFDKFYRTFYPQVVNYLNRKICNFHDAEDLAASIFEYAYGRFHTFDAEKASIKTWLYVIVNSRYKNYLRDRRELDDVDDYTDFVASEEAPMEQAMEMEEERKWLAEALKRLPERQREIIVLKYFSDLNSKQIGERLGMTESNVRVQMFRAMKRLQDAANEK